MSGDYSNVSLAEKDGNNEMDSILTPDLEAQHFTTAEDDHTVFLYHACDPHARIKRIAVFGAACPYDVIRDEAEKHLNDVHNGGR